MMVFNRAVLVLIVAFVFTPVIAGIVRFIEDLRFDKQVARRTARMTTGREHNRLCQLYCLLQGM